MKERPNILLILTDQHRYDIVGANGSPVCRSPNIDRLASRGVNFRRAYSACPLCTPTRASIYSGLAPHNHGILRNVEPGHPNAPSIGGEIPTLGERLGDAGYRTWFFGKWHAGERSPGRCGFGGQDIPGYGDPANSSYYLDYLRRNGLERPEVTPVGVGYPHNLLLAGRMSGPVEASIPYWLADSAIDILSEEAKTDQPFFIALNFWGPHAPYLPCEPYASMYDPNTISPWENFDDQFAGKPPLYQRHHDSFVGEGNPRRSWQECAEWAALYFGFATQIDAQIGRVINSLDELKLADSTAVIMSADHGDLTGSHGGMHDKNAFCCEELMHIPLIACRPGDVTAPPESALPVSNLDIPATVMDLAGLGIPAEFDGRSLLPILEGDAPADRPDYVVAECMGVHFAYETRMVVWDRWKYVFHPGATDELYDLETDPGELHNRVDHPDCKSPLDQCRLRLLRWMRRTHDPLHRAYFLFEKHRPWTAETVVPYGAGASNILLDREPELG